MCPFLFLSHGGAGLTWVTSRQVELSDPRSPRNWNVATPPVQLRLWRKYTPRFEIRRDCVGHFHSFYIVKRNSTVQSKANISYRPIVRQPLLTKLKYKFLRKPQSLWIIIIIIIIIAYYTFNLSITRKIKTKFGTSVNLAQRMRTITIQYEHLKSFYFFARCSLLVYPFMCV